MSDNNAVPRLRIVESMLIGRSADETLKKPKRLCISADVIGEVKEEWLAVMEIRQSVDISSEDWANVAFSYWMLVDEMSVAFFWLNSKLLESRMKLWSRITKTSLFMDYEAVSFQSWFRVYKCIQCQQWRLKRSIDILQRRRNRVLSW